ncbi:MAG: carboxynorspermidine decarboxylase [Lachnospiraceae bacterium]|nr:carboxynorspermidine decarboxylase [Lachnospiraceae bacterium]
MELRKDIFKELSTPCYVADEAALVKNLEILKDVKEKAGCRILLAQKAFSMFSLYPLIEKYLDGTTASGLYEARLGREEFNGEVHVYSPAYTESEIAELSRIADHVVFNSTAQVRKYAGAFAGTHVSLGLRVNPECSTQETAIYDPCAPGSRLGITAANFDPEVLEYIDGLHFHTLCEQNSDAFEVTLKAFEEKFGKYLDSLKWVNFGGGHHITRADYDRERLIRLIREFKTRHAVEVYLEPGEAIALNAGWLVTRVCDIVKNGMDIAILDASAACHMPDVLEMPYRPPMFASGKAGEKAHTYRLASRTCLAGDIIGDYSFDCELHEGDILSFEDMAIYSMVKNNTFNGMPLPDIGILHADGRYETVKTFGYEDFKGRLS